jgi:ribonuclease T2
VSSILDKLQDKWMSVQNVSNEDVEFWSHEWVKHGTCAAQLTQLGSELKFFSQALDWAAKYDMKTILDTVGIKPKSSAYDANTIWSGVKSVTGHKPILNCFNHNVSPFIT